MMTDTTDEPYETADQSTRSPLSLRGGPAPVSLAELAALKGEALEVVEARVQILITLRKAAIRATSPEDWLLFRAPEEQGGQIVGYLQDVGGQRVRDLYGIEIFDVRPAERVVHSVDSAIFMYVQRASGRCRLTRQTVEDVEGARASGDDFCRGKTGADLDLAVRKATRANLDGRITRQLSGLGSVPVDELSNAWAGTSKRVDMCRHGRGFGSRDARLGAAPVTDPTIPPPICEVCGTTGKYRPAKDGRPAFYGCPRYTSHPDQKWIVNADKWAETSAGSSS